MNSAELSYEEIEKVLEANPGKSLMLIAKELGVNHCKVYNAKYRMIERKKKEIYQKQVNNKPKAVPVELKVRSKYGYETFKGYDVSSYWGL